MKNFQKFSLALITFLAAVSLTSCSVEYRARHPKPVRHVRPKRVIVVGMTEPVMPVNTNTTAFTKSHNKQNTHTTK
jgi:hypothetical protein